MTTQKAYATKDDAFDKYGEDYVLTSVTRDSKPDLKAFSRALTNATSEIDSYVGARYTVPLVAPVPDIIVGYCVDIAIYKSSADPGTHTDEKRRRYDDAVEWLTKVAKGTVSILTLNAAGEEVDEDDTDMPIMKASPRLFSRRTQRGLA